MEIQKNITNKQGTKSHKDLKKAWLGTEGLKEVWVGSGDLKEAWVDAEGLKEA